jgi:hypothetical protein
MGTVLSILSPSAERAASEFARRVSRILLLDARDVVPLPGHILRVYTMSIVHDVCESTSVTLNTSTTM